MSKVISIIWEDSRQIPRWQYVEDIDEDICLCHTIGWFVKESKTAYFVATTFADNEAQVGQVVVIPKSCVKELREINI